MFRRNVLDIAEYCPFDAFFAWRCCQRALITPVVSEVDFLEEILDTDLAGWVWTLHIKDLEDGVKEGRVVVRRSFGVEEYGNHGTKMGVSALIVVDNVHLRIVLNAIDKVFTRGMKANLHRLECLFLS